MGSEYFQVHFSCIPMKSGRWLQSVRSLPFVIDESVLVMDGGAGVFEGIFWVLADGSSVGVMRPVSLWRCSLFSWKQSTNLTSNVYCERVCSI